MEESKRKCGRNGCGDYHLISVKDPGCPWEGVLWVKVKSLKEFDALSEEEQSKRIINSCPFQVQRMSFPTEYPYVRSECKKVALDHNLCGESSNCIFLFKYANSTSYNCRLTVKNDGVRVYE